MSTPMHDHCHEDMGDDPCGKTPVAYRGSEEFGPYPVCRRHHRPPYWVGLPEVEAEIDHLRHLLRRAEATR